MTRPTDEPATVTDLAESPRWETVTDLAEASVTVQELADLSQSDLKEETT
jgi:hypothetical protein